MTTDGIAWTSDGARFHMQWGFFSYDPGFEGKLNANSFVRLIESKRQFIEEFLSKGILVSNESLLLAG
jgi:hypothetical protein